MFTNIPYNYEFATYCKFFPLLTFFPTTPLLNSHLLSGHVYGVPWIAAIDRFYCNISQIRTQKSSFSYYSPARENTYTNIISQIAINKYNHKTGGWRKLT